MNVLIPTIGTRGDLQPYIALGLGLQAAGMDVTIASHPLFQQLVESYGLRYGPIGPDIDLGLETARIRGNGRSIDGGFLRVMKFSFDMLEQCHPDLLKLACKADRIIVSHSAAGSIEADMLEIPHASATLFPQAIPAEDPNQSRLNKLIGKGVGGLMGLVMTRPLDQIRLRLGLPKMGRYGITSPVLNYVAVSPHIIPPNPYWEERHRMTGFWFADTPSDWQPSDNLLAFLEHADKPVVFSLGAMSLSEQDAHIILPILISAIEKAGVRAIIQGWTETIQGYHLSPNVFPLGSVPHGWLLDRAAGIVHHGGFGTTASGLRAGIPQLIIPFIIDQFLWGKLSAEKGFGVKPISRKDLTADRLAQSLVELVGNQELKQQAAQLGQKIRSEDGVARAVELFNQKMG